MNHEIGSLERMQANIAAALTDAPPTENTDRDEVIAIWKNVRRSFENHLSANPSDQMGATFHVVQEALKVAKKVPVLADFCFSYILTEDEIRDSVMNSDVKFVFETTNDYRIHLYAFNWLADKLDVRSASFDSEVQSLFCELDTYQLGPNEFKRQLTRAVLYREMFCIPSILKIMLIDANVKRRWAIKELLALWNGMKVFPVTDFETLKPALVTGTNLVIIAQELPGLDGIEYAESLKKQSKTGPLYVISVSDRPRTTAWSNRHVVLQGNMIDHPKTFLQLIISINAMLIDENLVAPEDREGYIRRLKS